MQEPSSIVPKKRLQISKAVDPTGGGMGNRID